MTQQLFARLSRGWIWAGLALVMIACALGNAGTNVPQPVGELQWMSPYFAEQRFLVDGKTVVKVIIAGPAERPAGYPVDLAMLEDPDVRATSTIVGDVPAFTWCFGCSPTSAAMIAGYYDRVGYPRMYTGPTNGGVMPLDNSSWGTWLDSCEAVRAQCPLSATRQGLDGRTSRGHVDDYWICYDREGPDPYVTNGWTEHTHGDCTADYMGTSQWKYENKDGATTFWFFLDGSRYDVSTESDGGYGLQRFYESRGYVVAERYNQYIYGYKGNTKGFTLAQYKAEIDAGRPVMIHVEGHTMVGIGYSGTSNVIYIHDTWDHAVHQMTWGGSYAGMVHMGVTIVRLAQVPKADIYILADTTGSMTPAIAAVRAGAAQLVNRLRTELEADLAFGVGDYRDFPYDPYAFKHSLSITTDTTAVVAAINAWSLGWGGDGPEGQFYAFDQIAENRAPSHVGGPAGTIGWREGAKRILVVFGDYPAHDPICSAITYQVPGHGVPYSITEASVTNKLVAVGIVFVGISVVTGSPDGMDGDPTEEADDYEPFCGSPGGSRGQATRLATATGGASERDVPVDQLVATMERLIREAVVSVRIAVAVEGEGTTEPGPGVYSYPRGSEVTFTAVPTAGWVFVHWTEGGTPVWANSTYTFLAEADRNLVAVFQPGSLCPPGALFCEDFEDTTGWTSTGLWHFCRDACFGCTLLSGKYAHYAWPGTCSYASSVRTRGFLTSPVIPVPANTDLVVQFDLARVVESLPRVTRDRTYVQLRIGKGAWRTIWSRSSQNPSPECQTFAFGFNTKRNTQIQIRFVFDSVRRDSPALPGWAVDNVVVMPRSLVPTGVAVAEEYLDLDLEEGESPWFVLTVTPNPLTSGRNVVFAVDGVEAEAIRVEVYDVSGRLVYKGEGVGNQLTWNLTDTTGRLVANGLYLALAYAKVNGEWIASDLEKVLILR